MRRRRGCAASRRGPRPAPPRSQHHRDPPSRSRARRPSAVQFGSAGRRTGTATRRGTFAASAKLAGRRGGAAVAPVPRRARGPGAADGGRQERRRPPGDEVGAVVVDEADDVREGRVLAQLAAVVARDSPLLPHGREELGLLDGVDAEVGFEVELGVEHLGRVAGLLGHDGQDARQDRVPGRAAAGTPAPAAGTTVRRQPGPGRERPRAPRVRTSRVLPIPASRGRSGCRRRSGRRGRGSGTRAACGCRRAECPTLPSPRRRARPA